MRYVVRCQRCASWGDVGSPLHHVGKGCGATDEELVEAPLVSSGIFADLIEGPRRRWSDAIPIRFGLRDTFGRPLQPVPGFGSPAWVEEQLRGLREEP